jgi:probable rRNA maturation factor
MELRGIWAAHGGAGGLVPEEVSKPASRIIFLEPEIGSCQRAAPRTMILLDPDLDPGPRSKANAAKRRAGRESSRNHLQLPSAQALTRFLKRAQVAVGLRGEVSVLLTTDGTMRRLNRSFRGINKTTDVLSFPATHRSQVSESRPFDELRAGFGALIGGIAGDLAISVETALQQSFDCGHSLETEIRILMLHGLLHLHGFDHEKDAGEMARRERALRARLGLEQGLIERASPPLATGKSRKNAARKSVRSHPSRKDKGAARVGHPIVVRNGNSRRAR